MAALIVTCAFLLAGQTKPTAPSPAKKTDGIDTISVSIEKFAVQTLDLAEKVEKYAEQYPVLKGNAEGTKIRTGLYANSMVMRVEALKILNAYESAFDALKVAPDANQTKSIFWHKNLLLSSYELVEVIPEIVRAGDEDNVALYSDVKKRVVAGVRRFSK